MPTSGSKLTAADIVTAVRRHYGAESDGFGPEWAALAEFSLTPAGYSYGRIDLMLVRAWGGKPKGHERHAVEVKVSRSDLAAELARPEKSERFRAVAHRFYLATPAGLVRPGELPDGWGLLEVTARGVRETQHAERREPEPMPETALVEAFRRAARAEARVRDATVDDPAALIAQLRRDLVAAERSRIAAAGAVVREREKRRVLAGWLANFLPAPCVCGSGDVRLRPDGGSRYGHVFEHVESPLPGGCYGARPDIDALMDRTEVTA